MLSARALVSADGVEIFDVACRHRRGRGLAGEQTGGHCMVFVRRGRFVRSADGSESLLDPTTAYCMNPGEEQRYDHPGDGGDDCTSLTLDADLLSSLWGGDPRLPTRPLHTSAEIDLEHRLLLNGARCGADRHQLIERAIDLVTTALERSDAGRVASGRPPTARARRAVVDGAREILAANPDSSLPELARSLAVSAHHLSRIFAAATGYTISRHRMRLRTRAALERLAGGESDLGRLAADLGFADQSHLCRVLHTETGSSPSALREILAEPRPSGRARRSGDTYGEGGIRTLERG